MISDYENVRYLLFDIESVADPNLTAAIRHPDGDVEPDEAVRLYREELMEKKGSDFIPYSFQFPVSLALAKVRDDYSLAGTGLLRFEDGGPGRLTKNFWDGWMFYRKPTLVTFNGRSFDVPLLEQMALRYAIPIPDWFALGTKTYDQPRNRYNIGAHLDLCDILTNFGATHYTGGLNLAAKVIKHPGKMGNHGDMVQDLFNERKFQEIHDYCRCDVLDTYFLFLRLMTLTGRIASKEEKELAQEALNQIKEEARTIPALKEYLEAWKAATLAPTLDDYCRSVLEGGEKEEKAEE